MSRDSQAARPHRWLRTAGVSSAVIEELSRYTANVFDLSSRGPGVAVPLADEPFVACWAAWVEEARRDGAFAVLARHLPQLSFPIRQGISRTEAFRAATLRGVPVAELLEATGLGIERPELIELELYSSFAGRIPILIARGRTEFVALVRALAKKNEPVTIPEAQGAVMVTGYNNWARIRELRREWSELATNERATSTWNEEFARILERKELYQDRFIVISDGPYSAIPAADLGLSDSQWREQSLVIRREHECAHYLTRRLFGSMRNHLLDELIADYTGLVAALGRYRADWFLRFVGLEDYPRYRSGARLDIYRGDPPLSDRAFEALHTLVKAAAENLERFDAATWASGPRSLVDRSHMIQALASLRLEQLAADDSHERLERALADVRGN